MTGLIRRRLWSLSRQASVLAELHNRLHEISAPSPLREAGAEDRLLHLDLHPENVIVSPAGPVVIDWTNARCGEPALDVATTWVILATSGAAPGRLFLRSFLPRFDRDEVVRALPVAADRRIADPNVTDREREAVRHLVRQNVR